MKSFAISLQLFECHIFMFHNALFVNFIDDY